MSHGMHIPDVPESHSCIVGGPSSGPLEWGMKREGRDKLLCRQSL